MCALAVMWSRGSSGRKYSSVNNATRESCEREASHTMTFVCAGELPLPGRRYRRQDAVCRGAIKGTVSWAVLASAMYESVHNSLAETSFQPPPDSYVPGG